MRIILNKWCKSQDNRSLYSTQTMTNLQTLDENYNADLLDAMADRANELEEAMCESEPQEWEGYDDES